MTLKRLTALLLYKSVCRYLMYTVSSWVLLAAVVILIAILIATSNYILVACFAASLFVIDIILSVVYTRCRLKELRLLYTIAEVLDDKPFTALFDYRLMYMLSQLSKHTGGRHVMDIVKIRYPHVVCYDPDVEPLKEDEEKYFYKSSI